MSRAFVKDDDGGPEPVFDRPVSSAPNYVTPRGRRLLREALSRAQKSGNEREERYFRERLDSAIVVEPPKKPLETVEFGATVSAHDARGTALRVRIVGEDEADPLHGLISWESPVARAFTDRRVGERVVVQRPAGLIEYTIDAVSFED
jgi:transcription elongation GreA/GreB family factor